MNDPQRESVYDAEERIYQGAQLYCPDHVCRYVASVTGSAYWVAAGGPPVTVHFTSSTHSRRAWGGWSDTACEWFVRFPTYRDADTEAKVTRNVRMGWRVDPKDWPWSWRELVICHELAHVLTMATTDSPQKHGSKFCSRFLEIVERVMGRLAARELALSFRMSAVGFQPPDTPAGPLLRTDALRAAGWVEYQPLPVVDVDIPANVQRALA